MRFQNTGFSDQSELVIYTEKVNLLHIISVYKLYFTSQCFILFANFNHEQECLFHLSQ